MSNTITKVSKTDKVVKETKSGFKPYQIRINITRELYNDIQRAKATQFKYLDDSEIAKIFLSRGAVNTLPEIDYTDIPNTDLSKGNLNIFNKNEIEEDDLIDWSKAKPVNWKSS